MTDLEQIESLRRATAFLACGPNHQCLCPTLKSTHVGVSTCRSADQSSAVLSAAAYRLLDV
jgi:hypothetical protein